MKNSLLKKLFAIIVASALCTVATHAQIIYTDVKPDEIIHNSTYYFDLNNDGTADFGFYSQENQNQVCKCGNETTKGPGEGATALTTPPEVYNRIAHSQNIGEMSDIKRLDSNTIIDAFLFWEGDGDLARDGGYCGKSIFCSNKYGSVYVSGSPSGLWGYSINKYMGLQLKVGSNIYYGWARLDVQSSGSSVTLKDYAYNSIPNQPILAGEANCSTPTVTLKASGSLSFCNGDSVKLTANGSGYLYQWKKNGTNISGATSQTYVAKTAGTYKCKVTNSCGSIASAGKIVAVTCLQSNLAISDEKLISKATQLQITPNPFSSSTTISFTLPQTQKAMPAGRQVSIRVFDVTGILIKVLANSEMQAGTHQLEWNAKDENGNAVSAGMYILKMQAGDYTETKKISVIR
jgi:hypothetical protein